MLTRRLARAAAAATAAAAAGGVLAGCSFTVPVGAPPAPATGSPSAPAPAPSAFSPPGPGRAPSATYPVRVREIDVARDGRPLPTTIWYPRTDSGRFPVIVFSHGLGGQPDDYADLLRRWAASGFVVAAPAYPHTSRGAADFQVLDVVNQPADASAVLTRVLALDKRTGDPLEGRLAADRVAAAGHSAGGITTVGMFTGKRDPRLDAGIVLAGSSLGVGTGFRGAPAPLLFVHGQKDDVVSYAAGKAAYEAVPWPKAMVSFPDGDHGQAALSTGSAEFSVIADASAEFLRWSLYADKAAKKRLPADVEKSRVATLDNHL